MENFNADKELERFARRILKDNIYPKLVFNGEENPDYRFCESKEEQYKDWDVDLTFKNSNKTFHISEKARKQKYDDILVEIIKNLEKFRKYKSLRKRYYGWGVDSKCNFFVYYIMETNYVYIIDNRNSKFVEFAKKSTKNNIKLLKEVIHVFEERGLKNKRVLFDCGYVTVTRAYNPPKQNGEEYNTISVCYPIDVLRENGFIVYEGKVDSKEKITI